MFAMPAEIASEGEVEMSHPPDAEVFRTHFPHCIEAFTAKSYPILTDAPVRCF